MSITKTNYGTTAAGKVVYCYTLDNGKGLSAEILSLGGIIKNIYVSDKNGKKTDVVLGRSSLAEYEHNDGYLGAAIGRHANRIKNSEFTLGDTTYHVGANEGKNSLHGGINGFNQKVWEVQEQDGEEPALALSIVSPDGEEGFPGTLKLTITYTLTKENAFRIHYHAVSDHDTVCNLTNHSYFNLGGHASGTVEKQILQLNSGFYTPNDDENMPNGEVLSVTGTPFDFRVPKPIGQDLHSDFEQVRMHNGFDHNFAIEGRGFRTFATAKCLETGISMEVRSDQSAVQLYTANMLDEGVYKEGAKYGTHNAFCLETQCFPNAMAHSHYPAPILKKDETYDTVTEYRFRTE